MGFYAQLAIVVAFLAVLGMVLAAVAITTIKEFERGVVLTLGRFSGIRQPGVRFILPIINQIEKVDTREKVSDVLPQIIQTKDNIRITVNAVVNYRVVDARRAVLDVEDFERSTLEMAQSVLRAAIQNKNLDDISDLNALGFDVQRVSDARTKEWGVVVESVDVKEIIVDEALVRDLGLQAEAERRRRAKVIQADGELEAAVKLRDAARILREEPGAMQLRYLETVANMSNEKSSTILFPFPTDLNQMLGKQGVSLEEVIKSPVAQGALAALATNSKPGE